MMEYCSGGVMVSYDPTILHHSNCQLPFLGARNIKLKTADVANAAPNSAKERP